MTSVHTIDKATSINEVQLGQPVARSVNSGARAEFDLLLAMFSPNVTETASTTSHEFEKPDLSSSALTQPQSLRHQCSTEEAFKRGDANALQFHQGGLQSVKLMDALRPEFVIEKEDSTYTLGEDVYQNLSGHQRRMLATEPSPTGSNDLYDQILINWRDSHTSRNFM